MSSWSELCRLLTVRSSKRLWAGDTSAYRDGDNDGYSEADLALCSLLAFWCEPNEERIDRLFRQSGLYRPKWDKRHYGDGRTYGQGTIANALKRRSDFWRGSGPCFREVRRPIQRSTRMRKVVTPLKS
jgi:putative DNA primase/helicase